MRKFDVAVVLVALSLAACGSKKEPVFPEDAAAAKGAAPEASPPKEALPPGVVARGDVDGALMRGPGWLLNRIQAEEVLKQNKFVGWRLTAFPADWDSSGLQPGDVITEVNGTVIEKPDDLWNVWLAVADANEIRFAFERDGKPASVALKIHGAPVPETRKALEGGVMSPSSQGSTQGAQAKPGKQRFETKVIGGEEPPEVSD
jgi:hypothetical protein